MSTFVSIGIYSVMVLGALSAVAGAFIFLSIWLVDQSEDHEAH